jgi:hypothetical protein
MNDRSAIMTKQHKSTLLLFAAPLPAAPAKTGFVARFQAALAGLKAFFARPAESQAKKAAPQPRSTRAPRVASGERVTQRKHLRVVHTGTRI